MTTKGDDVRLDDNEIQCAQCEGFRKYCKRQTKMEKKLNMIR